MAAPPGCEADARRFNGGLLGLIEMGKPAPLRGRGGVWFACAGAGQLHVEVEDPFHPAAKPIPRSAWRRSNRVEVLGADG